MARARAAVIGAGRIGRHHAKWYTRCGCELAAFVVSTPEHLAARRGELLVDSPEVGAGYTDYERMLDEVRPDLVSVCTPAEGHHAPARAALERGIPVLCEKPLVWDADPDTARAQGAELCALADRQGVPLAVNLQYTCAATGYRELVGNGAAPRNVTATLESRGKGAERTPAEVWMELGPHALSLALALVPGGRLVPASVTAETAPRTVTARFDLAAEHGTVAAIVTVSQRLEGDLIRRFGVNDQFVDYAGRNNADGVYCTYLSRAGVEREYPDVMRAAVEQFVARARGEVGSAAVEGRAGLANLEAQLLVAQAVGGRREK